MLYACVYGITHVYTRDFFWVLIYRTYSCCSIVCILLMIYTTVLFFTHKDFRSKCRALDFHTPPLPVDGSDLYHRFSFACITCMFVHSSLILVIVECIPQSSDVATSGKPNLLPWTFHFCWYDRVHTLLHSYIKHPVAAWNHLYCTLNIIVNHKLCKLLDLSFQHSTRVGIQGWRTKYFGFKELSFWCSALACRQCTSTFTL